MADTILKRSKGIHKFQRHKDQIIRDTVCAICLCHNVTPVEDEGKIVVLFLLLGVPGQ
jgi:hypothetical protein